MRNRGIDIRIKDKNLSIKGHVGKINKQELECLREYKNEIMEYLRDALKEGSRMIRESFQRVAYERPDGWDLPEEIGERIDQAALSGDLAGLRKILREWEEQVRNQPLLYGTGN